MRRGRQIALPLCGWTDSTTHFEEDAMSDNKCSLCHGTGSLWSQKDASLAGLQVKVTCPSCGGSGRK